MDKPYTATDVLKDRERLFKEVDAHTANIVASHSQTIKKVLEDAGFTHSQATGSHHG